MAAASRGGPGSGSGVDGSRHVEKRLISLSAGRREVSQGFSTWHQRQFPRTHNLTVLSGFCAELDSTLDAVLAPSLALTRFAVTMRYPGEIDEPSIEEVREWMAVARAIFEAICARLPRETTRACESHHNFWPMDLAWLNR